METRTENLKYFVLVHKVFLSYLDTTDCKEISFFSVLFFFTEPRFKSSFIGIVVWNFIIPSHVMKGSEAPVSPQSGQCVIKEFVFNGLSGFIL